MMTTILGTICCIRTVEPPALPPRDRAGSGPWRRIHRLQSHDSMKWSAALTRFYELVRCPRSLASRGARPQPDDRRRDKRRPIDPARASRGAPAATTTRSTIQERGEGELVRVPGASDGTSASARCRNLLPTR